MSRACTIKRNGDGTIDKVYNVLSLPKSNVEIFNAAIKSTESKKGSYQATIAGTSINFRTIGNNAIEIESVVPEKGVELSQTSIKPFIETAFSSGITMYHNPSGKESKVASFLKGMGFFKEKTSNRLINSFAEIARYNISQLKNSNLGTQEKTKAIIEHFKDLISLNTGRDVISTDLSEMEEFLREIGFGSMYDAENKRFSLKLIPESVRNTRNIRVIDDRRVIVRFQDGKFSKIRTPEQAGKVAENISKKIADNIKAQLGSEFKPNFVVLSKYTDGSVIEIQVPAALKEKFNVDPEVEAILDEMYASDDFAFMKDELQRGVSEDVLEDLGYRFMSTPAGEVYGMFVKSFNGVPKIFIDPLVATPETVVEEMAHLQYAMMEVAASNGDAKANVVLSKEKELIGEIVDKWNTLEKSASVNTDNTIRTMTIAGQNYKAKEISSDVVNGFYSPLFRRISEGKQEKLPAKQWLEKFATSEEAKWTRLRDYLESYEGNEVVSKQDLISFLKRNRINISEIRKGDDNIFAEVEKEFNSRGYDINRSIYGELEFTDRNGEVTDYEILPDELKDILDNNRINLSEAIYKEYSTKGSFENYREILLTLPSNFKSKFHQNFVGNHWDEPNIIVHLRINTRLDSDGNKVLFIEEIQSDWGQGGREDGFSNISDKDYEDLRKELNSIDEKIDAPLTPEQSSWVEKLRREGLFYYSEDNGSKRTLYRPQRDFEKPSAENYVDVKALPEDIKSILPKVNEWQDERSNLFKRKAEIQNILIDAVPYSKYSEAPFVTDTNSWTKLALKVALKEAVKDGANKIAWSNAEQQVEKFDLSGQISEITYDYDSSKDSGTLIVVDNEGHPSSKGKNISKEELKKYIGAEPAARLIDNLKNADSDNPQYQTSTLSGNDIKIGDKGMIGYYGSPKESTIGIVGKVGQSLFKQEPSVIKINTAPRHKGYVEVLDKDNNVVNKYGGADSTFHNAKKEAARIGGSTNFVSAIEYSELHAFDITPEIQQQVAEGLPLFNTQAQASQAEADSLYEQTGVDLRADVYRQQADEADESYANRLNDEVRAKLIANFVGKKIQDIESKGGIFSKISDWLKSLTNWVKELFGIQYLSDSHINKMTLSELVEASSAGLLQGNFLENLDFSREENFNKWKGDNELFVGSEIREIKTGQPVVVEAYHGTTHSFYEFKGEDGMAFGFLGKVNYFSSDYNDSETNYTSTGADPLAKIDYYKNLILNDIYNKSVLEIEEEYDVSIDGVPNYEYIANKIATELVLGTEAEDKVLEVYIKLNNPVVIGGGVTSYYEIYDNEVLANFRQEAIENVKSQNGIEDDELEDYEYDIRNEQINLAYSENPVIEALQDALDDISGYYGRFSARDLLDGSDVFYGETEIDLSKLEKIIRENDKYVQFSDENGDFALGSVISKFFENLGFDGIILTDPAFRFFGLGGMTATTSHIHVFPKYKNQIKLSDGSNVTFNPATVDIRYSTKIGKESKLFEEINSNPHVESKEQAKDLFMNTFSSQFKSKFGDWEGGQVNSAVLNEDGEPQLFYLTDSGFITTSFKEALKNSNGSPISMGFVSSDDILNTDSRELFDASVSDFSKLGNEFKLSNKDAFINVADIDSSTDSSSVAGFTNRLIMEGIANGKKENSIKPEGTNNAEKAINSSFIEQEARIRYGSSNVSVNDDYSVTVTPEIANVYTVVDEDGNKKELDADALYTEMIRGNMDKVRSIVGSIPEFLYHYKRMQVDSFYSEKANAPVDEKEETTLRNNLLSLLKSLGFSVTTITEYAKNYALRKGVDLSVDAIADIANNVVAFAEGKMTDQNLAEETAHIIIEAYMNQAEIREALSEVDKTGHWNVYSNEYYEKYSKMYSGEELETAVRKEVLGKILRDKIIDNFDNQNKTNEEVSIFDKLKNIFNSFISRLQSIFTPKHKSRLDKLTDKLADITQRKSAQTELNRGLLGESQIVLYSTGSDAQVENLGVQNDRLRAKLIKQREELEINYRTLLKTKSADTTKVKLAIKNIEKEIEDNNLLTAAKISLATHESQVTSLERQLRYYKKQSTTSGKQPFFNVGDQAVHSYLKNVALPSLIELNGLVKDKDSKLFNDLSRLISKINEIDGEVFAQQADDAKLILEKLTKGFNLLPAEVSRLNQLLEQEQKDVSGFQRLYGNLAHSSNIFLNMLGKLINNIYYKVDTITRQTVNPLLKKAKTEGWSMDKFRQIIKRDENGKNSGYLLSEVDRGKFDAEEAKFKEDWFEANLTEEEKEKLKKEGRKPSKDILDETRLAKYIEDQIEWSIENEELFFKPEYYREREEEFRQAGISSDNRAFLADNSRRATDIKHKYRNADGSIDRSRMTEEELDTLASIKHDMDLRKNSYNIYGELKTGEEKRIAEELQRLFEIRRNKALARIAESGGLGIRESFFKTIENIEESQSREAALKFLLANGGITFSDAYWDSVNQGSKVTYNGVEMTAIEAKKTQAEEMFFDRGDIVSAQSLNDAYNTLMEAKEARKQMLKQYLRANNPAELNTNIMIDSVKERFIELDEIIQEATQTLNARFKELEMPQESTNEYEYTTNEAYKEDLAIFLNENHGSTELDFLNQNMTDGNKNRVKLLKSQLTNIRNFGSDRMSKSFRNFLSREYNINAESKQELLDFVKRANVDEILLKYGRAKAASYYKRFAPMGYETFLEKLKNGGEPVFEIAKDLQNGLYPNYSISTSFDWAMDDALSDKYNNDNYNVESDQGFKQPKLSKYRDDEFFRTFNPTLVNGKYVPSTNKAMWDMIETFKGIAKQAHTLYGEERISAYKLPMKHKSTIERRTKPNLNSMIEGIKDLGKNREDEQLYGAQEQGVDIKDYGINVIPRYYLNTLKNKEDISENLIDSYSSLLYEANLYNERLNTIQDVLLLKQKLMHSSFTKGVKPENTNTLKQFDNFVGAYFYGQKQTMKSEFRIGNRTFDVTKIANTIDNGIRRVNVGFSLPIAVSSAAVSNVNFKIERLIGEHVSNESAKWATKEMMKLLPSYASNYGNIAREDKLYVLSEAFGLNSIKERTVDAPYNKVIKAISDSPFSFMEIFATPHNAKTMLSVADDFRLVNGKIINFLEFKKSSTANGLDKKQIKEEWGKHRVNSVYNITEVVDGQLKFKQEVIDQIGEEMATAQMNRMRSKVVDTISNIDALIPETDRSVATRHYLLNFTTAHRGWLTLALQRRFKRGNFNFSQGVFEEGHYRSFGRFIRDTFKIASAEGLSNFVNVTKDQWKYLNDEQKKNIRRVGLELAAFLLLTMLTMLVAAADDDDKNKDDWTLHFVSYLYFRTVKELGSSQIPAGILDVMDTVKSPFVAISSIDRLRNNASLDIVDRGYYKGYPKFIKGLAGQTWARHLEVYDTETLKKKSDYYRLQNSVLFMAQKKSKEERDADKQTTDYMSVLTGRIQD